MFNLVYVWLSSIRIRNTVYTFGQMSQIYNLQQTAILYFLEDAVSRRLSLGFISAPLALLFLFLFLGFSGLLLFFAVLARLADIGSILV